MKRPTETFDDPAAFRAAAAGKGKGKGTRVKGTASTPGQGDQHGALMRLSTLHYYVRWRAGAGFDCWSPYSDRTTTAHADYADAVRAAEQELSDVNNA